MEQELAKLRILDSEGKECITIKNADGKIVRLYQHLGKWVTAVTTFCPSSYPIFLETLDKGKYPYDSANNLMRIHNYDEVEMGLIEFVSNVPCDLIASALRLIVGVKPKQIIHQGNK